MNLNFVSDTKTVAVIYILMLIPSIIIAILGILLELELIFFSAIIIIARFLSGLGFLGMIFVGITYLFKFIPKDYRKKKTGKIIAKITIIIVILSAFIVPTLELMKLLSGTVSVSILSAAFGVLSFIISMYILPAWKEKQIGVDEGTLESIKRTFGKLSKKIKRGYYYYLSRDYLKAYSIDFIFLKSQIDYRRTKIAGLALPVLVIGLLYNPPLAIIVFVYLLRYRKDLITPIDNIFFTIATFVGSMYPIVTLNLSQLALIWAAPYIIGGYITFVMFIPPLISLLLD